MIQLQPPPGGDAHASHREAATAMARLPGIWTGRTCPRFESGHISPHLF